MTENSFGIVPVMYNNGEPLFLILKHANKGHWSFPKGRANAGETALETAKREFEEETGISSYDVIADYPIDETDYTFEFNSETVHKFVTYFIGIVHEKSVSMQDGEIADYAWLGYEDAMARITYQNSKDVLKKAFARLYQHSTGVST